MASPKDHVEHGKKAAEGRGDVASAITYGLALWNLMFNPGLTAGDAQYQHVRDVVRGTIPQGEYVYLYYTKHTYEVGDNQLPVIDEGSFLVTGTSTPPLTAHPDELQVEVISGEATPPVKLPPDAAEQVRQQTDRMMNGDLQLQDFHRHEVVMQAGPHPASRDEIRALNDKLKALGDEKPDTTSALPAADDTDRDGTLIADVPPAVSDPVLMDPPVAAPDDGGEVAVASVRAMRAPARTATAAPGQVLIEPLVRELADRLGRPAGAIPAHPEWGLPSVSLAWEDKAAKLRARDGDSATNTGLVALLDALLDADPDLKPFIPAAKLTLTDGDAYTTLLACGHWRGRAETLEPGDLAWVADGACPDGVTLGIALKAGGAELLTLDPQNRYAVRGFPPTGSLAAAWQPVPRWGFNPKEPGGAFWGPDMAGMRDLLDTFYANDAVSSDDLAASLAARCGVKDAGTVPALTAALLPAMHRVTDGTPLWPGTILLGRRDGEIGVLLRDGNVLGSCAVDAYPTRVTTMSLLRFRPRLVWYPGAAA